MQRRVLVVLAALLLGVMGFAAAGCGSKSSTATPAGEDTTTVATDTTTTADETTTDSTTTVASDTTTTTESDTTTTSDTPDLSFLTSANCRQLAGLYQAFAAAFTGAGNDLDKTADLLDEFADETPEEIRDDFEVLAEAYGKIAKAFDGVDLSAGQAPSAEVIARLAALQGEIDSAKVAEASQNISEWAANNCTSG